jgi:hypothetical protein
MKSIDFTQPGGFPLTQDQLGYLQAAYTEATAALATMGAGTSTPVIISGMTVSNPSAGNFSVTDGWFFYNNEMVRCIASSVTGASGSAAPFISITSSAAPLVYYDGSAPNVVLEKTAVLQVLPVATSADATRFPLADIKPFGAGFGAANREAVWKTLNVSTAVPDGGVSGTVYYKKDHTANTLHIRGLLTSANAQNFAASPFPLYYLMGTLPVGYIPNNSTYFVATYFGSAVLKDDLGVAWLKQINCGINSTGQFYVNWLRPDIAVAAYGINFNTTIPLD